MAASVPLRQRAQRPGAIGHETGELHRLLVENVKDYAIFALDPHGYVVRWNAGTRERSSTRLG